MDKYEIEAKEYIKLLNSESQRRAVVAIEDAFKTGKDWRWIATALKKKSIGEWEKWGFGLFFNYRFESCVYKQIERDERCGELSIDSWLNGNGSFQQISHSNEDLDEEPIYKTPLLKQGAWSLT